MLIDPDTVRRLLDGIPIHGVLHIGAHDCEEMSFYNNYLGVSPDDIYWIEAIPSKVEECKRKSVPNVFQAIMTDQDDQTITFHISNNIQSSSILEFNTHAREHPHIHYVEHFVSTSITIDSFLEKNRIDPTQLNFWNLDIQGCELLALRGGCGSIRHVDVMYLEVNEEELYRQCALVHEIDAFLDNHDFKRVLTKMTPHGWGDAVYVRRDLLKTSL
jgi:FkbM family methyltransferase